MPEQCDAQLRLFRRGCLPQWRRAYCPPRQCCPLPAPSPSLYPTLELAEYACPVQYMYPVGGGLHLYYGLTYQAPNDCRDNPQPIYLNNPDSAGCASCNPDDTGCSHYCIATGYGYRGKSRRHDGVEDGYFGSVPPDFVQNNPNAPFNALYRLHGGRQLRVKFYLVTLTLGDGTPWAAGVGFVLRPPEFPEEEFPERDEVADEMNWLGPKGFDVKISGTPYRVLLRRGIGP